MGVCGGHSTRGAGVQLYEKLGLGSEQVCDLGKWKNTGGLSSHYLRVGAASVAAERLKFLVRSVPPRERAEPDQSRTPGNPCALGGRDWEGGTRPVGAPPCPPVARAKRPPSEGALSTEPPSKKR